MKFREFLFNEDPMGAPPMGGGMGGDPMGGGAPPMGGDPMGGGMGGDPMGGGAPPMGGGAPAEPPPIPQYADVWDVLDAIINNKPIEQEEEQKEKEQQKVPDTNSMGGNPGGQPHLMS